MTLMIAFTASASPSRGYSHAEADEMIGLFDAVLDGRATSKTVTRMLEIVDGAAPITASMRKAMRPVRLASDKARPDLAEITDKFWRDYRAKHPKPQQKHQPLIDTMRRRP